MHRHTFLVAAGSGLASLLILSGCTGTPDTPAPSVTATAVPETPDPEITEPAVGDELTPLNAWDICFAHTTTQVQSDLTEWSPYSPALVGQPSVGTLIVTIENVRSGGDADDFGTVTCRVEGRVGGAIIAEWSRP